MIVIVVSFSVFVVIFIFLQFFSIYCNVMGIFHFICSMSLLIVLFFTMAFLSALFNIASNAVFFFFRCWDIDSIRVIFMFFVVPIQIFIVKQYIIMFFQFFVDLLYHILHIIISSLFSDYASIHLTHNNSNSYIFL